MSSLRKSSIRANSEQKLRTIRALYFITYNSEKSLLPQAVELFHAIGEILEGIPPEDLGLHRIDKKALIRELEFFD